MSFNLKKLKVMSLIRYNRFANEFVPSSFGSLVDRFFNDSIARSGGSASSFIPRVDVMENEKAYEIHVAVPGMNKEDFKLDLNENLLTVSGERKFTRENKNGDVHAIETQYGTFARSFRVPEDADGGKISARYQNGILEVNIPKDEKKVLKTTIKVS